MVTCERGGTAGKTVCRHVEGESFMFWEMPGPATPALALAFRRAGVCRRRRGTRLFVHRLGGDLALLAQQGLRAPEYQPAEGLVK